MQGRPKCVTIHVGSRVLIPLLLILLSTPAVAQVDFSREWAPLYHEDSPERLSGPELGDYLELPLNDAAPPEGR